MENSREIKEQICDIGKRIYDRGFAAGNDGNISYRISENEVLCTPTMHSKGFLTPDDICTIDMEGTQIAGAKKRSSEALLHLEIMKERPEIKSVVHCHPPHATAFAIAREPIPQGILPEVEFFLGETPIAAYETPGGEALAATILPFVKKTNVIILANHGTVSYGDTVERAYWWTEVLDSYCRMLILARSLGSVHSISKEQCWELMELKKGWGFSDARHAEDFPTEEVLNHATFGQTWTNAGVERKAFPDPNSNDPTPPNQFSDAQVEKMVEEITRRVVEQLSGK